MTFQDKINIAIERLKIHEPKEGYYLAFSGGKDCSVVKALCDMAGVKYDSHYSVTTIDPPELVYFIREHHPEVIWERKDVPFLKEFVKRGAPRRQGRWCCEIYKEGGGDGRRVLTGVRHQESRNRSKRRLFEKCYVSKGKTYLHPIIDWSERDVWLFIGKFNVPYCTLYDEGRHRLGCLFCPMAKQKMRDEDVRKYPNFVNSFKRAFQALYDDRKAKGTDGIRNFKDGNEMWDWWISGLSTKAWCKIAGKPYILKKDKVKKITEEEI